MKAAAYHLGYRHPNDLSRSMGAWEGSREDNHGSGYGTSKQHPSYIHVLKHGRPPSGFLDVGILDTQYRIYYSLLSLPECRSPLL